MHFELEKAARSLIAKHFTDDQVAWPNIPFTPPADGGIYVKFNYMVAASEAVGISRKCRYYIGLVQVGIIFRPGLGNQYAREAASTLCKLIPEGLELDTGFVYTAAEVLTEIPSETGWMIPVRFEVRAEEHVK